MVTLTRPDRMNAINRATLQELDHILTALDGDPAVGAVVVTGAGTFSAGADITELAGARRPRRLRALLARVHDVLARLEAHPTPSIAAIDGVAFGGGLELAAACDLRVASDAARLGVPEVKLGLLPGAGGLRAPSPPAPAGRGPAHVAHRRAARRDRRPPTRAGERVERRGARASRPPSDWRGSWPRDHRSPTQPPSDWSTTASSFRSATRSPSNGRSWPGSTRPATPAKASPRSAEAHADVPGAMTPSSTSSDPSREDLP